MKKEKPEIVWSIKYLSFKQKEMTPEMLACYQAYCKMSYQEQAILDGYVALLSKRCGSMTGAFELIAKMGLWMKRQPEVNCAHKTTA